MANLKEVRRNTNIQTKEIHRSDGPCSRIFWLSVLLFTAMMFFYETYNSIHLYLNNPLASNLEQVFFKNTTLPAMSVCMSDAITHKVNRAFAKEENLFYMATAVAFVPPFFDRYGYGQSPIDEMKADEPLLRSQYEATMAALGKDNLHDYLLNDAGLEMSQTIRYCALRGKKFDCSDMFTYKEFWDADYCFIADAKKNYQSVPGTRGALTLHLNSEQVLSDDELTWSIWLYPHPGDDDMAGASFPEVVTAGFMVDLRVRKWRSKRINQGGNPCRRGIDRTFAQCQHYCEARASNKTCGCVRIGQFNEFGGWPYCEPGWSQGLCSYEEMGKVQCHCAVAECESVEYKAEVLVRKMTNNENTTIVRIYYDTLSEMVLEQKRTVSVAQLVGSFGGQASLWLGIKVATIAQFVFYGYRAVVQKWRGGAVEDSKA